jgi:hypothetical protein
MQIAPTAISLPDFLPVIRFVTTLQCGGGILEGVALFFPKL